MNIENKVKNLKTTSVEEFLSWQFNTLKSQRRDVTKLKNAIIKSGWSFPVIVWGKYVIDGAGRKKAVEELISEGYTIDSIPYVEIDAIDLSDAKQKALEVSSQFGDITKESFLEFSEGLELDFETFNFDFKELGNIEMLDTVNNGNEMDEWVNMPEFEEKDPTYSIIIHFESEQDRYEYAKNNNMRFSKKESKTWSTNYPFKERDDLSAVKYE